MIFVANQISIDDEQDSPGTTGTSACLRLNTVSFSYVSLLQPQIQLKSEIKFLIPRKSEIIFFSGGQGVLPKKREPYYKNNVDLYCSTQIIVTQFSLWK